jgi:hypothetical protein
MESMNAQELFDLMLESDLSERTKHELIEWLWAIGKLDDDQYKLAMSRVKHLAEKQS